MRIQNCVKLLFLAFLISFSACKNETAEKTIMSEVPASGDENNESTKSVMKLNEGAQVFSWIDRLRIRNAPDTDAAVLGELKEGEGVSYINETTDFYQKISLSGRLHEEPWVKIRTDNDITGWVYGGGLRFYKPVIDAGVSSPYEACQKLKFENKLDRFETCVLNQSIKELEKDRRYVKQSENGFIINLLNGSAKELNNSSPNQYQYRDYIPKMGYFIFESKGETKEEFVLINDKSGKEIAMCGFPKPSPDFKTLVAVKAGLNNENASNAVQVWGFTSSGFKKLFEEVLPESEPFLPKWLDSRNIQIKLKPSPTASNRKLLMNLIIGKEGKWQSV